MRTLSVLFFLAACTGGDTEGSPDPDTEADTSNPDEDSDTQAETGIDPDSDTDSDSDSDSDSDTGLSVWSAGAYASNASSGTRLTAIAVTDEHGNADLAWFYDTQLETRCRPRRAGDGLLRCIPAGPEVVSFGGYFATSDCSEEPLLLATSCEDASPEYILRTDTLGGGASVFEPTEVLTQVYNIGSRGNCQPVASVGPAYRGSTLASTTFVAFTRTVVPRSEDLGQVVYTGSDGSSLGGPLWDLERDESVVPFNADGSSTLYAVPYQDDVHADQLVKSTCGSTRNDTFVAPTRDPEPSFILYRADAFDPGGNPIGQFAEVRPITSTQTTRCLNNAEQPVGTGFTAYVIGSQPTDLTTFPELTYRWDEGPGVQLRHIMDGETPVAPWPAGGVPVPRLDGESLSVVAFDGDLVGFTTPTWPAIVYGSGCTSPIAEAQEAAQGDWVTSYAGDSQQCFDLPGAPNELLDVWSAGMLSSSLTYYQPDFDGFCQLAGNGPGRTTQRVVSPSFDVTFTE